MAYAKKTEATSNVSSVENTKADVVKEKKVFTDSDYILCRSVWSGGLYITCRSGNLYEFKDYGSECEINYRDLVDLVRKGSEHIFIPRFIILDDDFLKEFPTIVKAYDSMYTTTDLQEILDLPNYAMKAEIEKLPDTMKTTLSKMISTEIANGKLDSISKVQLLSEIFDSDFNLLSTLFVSK